MNKKKKMYMILGVFIMIFSVLQMGSFSYASDKESDKTLEDFKNKKIGVKMGSTQDLLGEKNFPNAKIFRFNSAPDLCEALNEGKIDAYLNDYTTGKSLADKYQNFAMINESLVKEEYGAVFSKTNKGTELKNKFNSFIAKIKKNGELDKIIKKWQNTDISNAPCLDITKLKNKNKEISLAADLTCFPFGFHVGSGYGGIEVEVAMKFCEDMGYGLKINDTLFDAIILNVCAGKSDFAMSALTITDERKESIDFSDSYYSDGTYLFYKIDDGKNNDNGFNILDSLNKTFIREGRYKIILSGMGTTVLITIFAAIFGSFIGYGICKLKLKNNNIVNKILYIYTKFFQGTPAVVLLMIFYYIVFSNLSLSNVSVAVIAFSLNFSAYVAEIMRSGIVAIDIGQREAALALGFSERESFRNFIFPQACEIFIPVYKGELITLLKNTSIVGYVAIQDLTKVGDIIRSRTYEALFPLIAITIIYFIITYIMMILLKQIEKRILPDKKTRGVKEVMIDD